MSTERTPDAAAGDERPALTPEMIERFRQTGIRLDREGRLWHQGVEITHPRLRRALLRWMDVRDSDNRAILRLDERRYAYIDVDDAHLLAVSARWDGDRAFVALNDGAEQELAYDTVVVGADDALYCRVRDGRLEARITTPAYYALAGHIVELSAPDGDAAHAGADRPAFALRARGQLFPIAARAA